MLVLVLILVLIVVVVLKKVPLFLLPGSCNGCNGRPSTNTTSSTRSSKNASCRCTPQPPHAGPDHDASPNVGPHHLAPADGTAHAASDASADDAGANDAGAILRADIWAHVIADVRAHSSYVCAHCQRHC